MLIPYYGSTADFYVVLVRGQKVGGFTAHFQLQKIERSKPNVQVGKSQTLLKAVCV